MATISLKCGAQSVAYSLQAPALSSQPGSSPSRAFCSLRESGRSLRKSISQPLKINNSRRLRAAPCRLGARSSLSGPVDDGNVKPVYNLEMFNQELEAAGNKLVVLDISTKTCGPCKLVYPKIVAMSKEYPDAVFLKINGDHDQETRSMMREWKIRAVPNFRFYRNGEMIHSHSGAKEEELRKNFKKFYEEVQAAVA